jgi:hypothetical protein
MATSNIHRAACVALLYELDRAGYLDGMTNQKIANLLDLGHRSTALRYMQDVTTLHKVLPELKEKIKAQGIPLND